MSRRTMTRARKVNLAKAHPGWTKRLKHAPGIYTLHYPDGSIRFEHPCKTVDGWRLTTAPRLQLGNGHTVVQAEPLTVRASIACDDCGIHGFITAGRWEPIKAQQP